MARYLEVENINYDYIPSQLESPKMLWVALKYPPPKDFRVDTLVRLHLKPGVGIRTSPGMPNLNSTFYVNDIIGLRVMLMPSTPGWAPNKIKGGCGNPGFDPGYTRSGSSFGWGHDMRQIDVRPSRQNWLFGYGQSTAMLEYHPVLYTTFPVLG